MVDIHSHVLYGIDDGAKTFEDSVEMLRFAFDSGTTDIVATPHSDLKFKFQPAEINRQLIEFNQISGIPQLHRGCDFHLSFDNIQSHAEAASLYNINGLRYLLVEFSNFQIPASIDDVFARMIRGGTIPIVTHPERNPLLSKNPKQLAEWIRAGCRIQVTGQSLTGRFGKQAESAARRLLENGMVHFVASDAHDLHHRPPDLQPAYKVVERECGAKTAEALLIHNPTAVLTGSDLPAASEGMPTPRRWFKLW